MATYTRQVFRDTFNSESNLKRDVTKGISLIEEVMQSAPLFKLLVQGQKGKRQRVMNFKYEWFQDNLAETLTTVTSDATSSATSFTLAVGEIGIFKLGDVVYNVNQNEHGRVIAAVTSTGAGNLTVQLTNGTAGSTWATSDEIINLNHANAENGTDPDAIMTQKSSLYNYCEDVLTPIEISDWAMEQGTEDGEKRLAYERKKAMIEHSSKWELKLLLGIRDTGTISSGRTWYTTGGILDANVGVAAAQKWNLAAAALDRDTFEDTILKTIWANGGSYKKLAICSPDGVVALNKLYRGEHTVNINAGKDKLVGISTRTIQHAFGQIEVISHPLLNTARLGATMGKMIAIIDPAFIHMVDYGSMGGVKLHKDRQNNNAHKYAETLRSIMGLKIDQRAAHGAVYNFTIPSA